MPRQKSSKIERACRVCSATFFADPEAVNRGFGLYCSRSCSGLARRSIMAAVVCESCGQTFEVKPKRAKSAKYCSNACVAQANVRPRAVRVCEVCGTEFVVLASALKYGPGRYCSRICTSEGQTRDVADRFWSKVDRSGGPDACWLWVGGDDGAGYGAFRIGRKIHRTHRVAFFLTHGRWPNEFLCHDCPTGDNPRCVNPAHMFEGDTADNNRDRHRKGRSAIGSRHGKATINEETVIAMRARFDAGGMSYRALAEAFGVPYVVAWQVATRRTWKHV